MYKLADVLELHVELTERCNAHCPMCGRNQNGGKTNVNLEGCELTLKFVEKTLPKTFVQQLTRVRMCGNFGDPAACSEATEICEALRSINPSLNISFHTNGGLKSPEWWYRLGRLFQNDSDELLFALDGLEDTLGLYRRGVDFKRVISNADAAIRAGAKAHWVMLVFEHNEHQVEQAKALANELGFASFRLKATKRFLRGRNKDYKQWPVESLNSGSLFTIRVPKQKRFINRVILANDSECIKQIECYALERKSLYISAMGEAFPCCWLASSLYPATKAGPIGDIADLLSSLGGINSLRLVENSIEEILEGPFFNTLTQLWKDLRPSVCLNTCNPNRNGFQARFIERVNFHPVK